LATVYGIVKQSNGYTGVDTAPGKGTSFRIFLPRYTGPAVVEEPEPYSADKLRGSETVLLVEDSEPLRKLVKTFLDSAGYQVFSAESGEAALEVSTRIGRPLDLLLTDVVMPGMNGRLLAEHLIPRHRGMKVLYMSGYTDSFIAGHGVLEPGTHLLHKPFTEEVFLQKVREVLDGGKKPSPGSDSVAELAGSSIRSGG
ncbi:MAG: response regulator, partial [Candidatus Acidiferrum sp.]